MTAHRIRKGALAILLLASLLSLSLLPVSATDGGVETPPPVFDTHYDETLGELSVYMHIVNAERGQVDLAPLFRSAAESGASIDLDAGPVKLYFSAAAIAEFSGSAHESLYFRIETLTEEEVEGGTEKRRYRISIGENDVSFPKGSVRVRFRYPATDPTLSCAYRVTESGEELALRSVYLDNVLSFYPDELGEFVVHEREGEKGTPKTVYLTVGLASLALAVSVLLTVLCTTGGLKRIYLRYKNGRRS